MVTLRPAQRMLATGVLALIPLVTGGCDRDAGRAPAIEDGSVAVVARAPVASSRAQPADTAALIAELGCGACHAGLPSPAISARPLAAGEGPRDPAALFVYLSDSLPAPPSSSGARMPDFHLTEPEALALALYLGRGRPEGEVRGAFERVREAHEDVDAADGALLYDAFQCAACHGGLGRAADAPPLGLEGARVRPEWLHAFVRTPHAIRPFGATPGSGSRMPNFGLTAGEADAIAAFLVANPVELPPFDPAPPTAFGAAKVEALLEARYDCLGCHALDGAGGRIAPDLALASVRLTPAYIRAMLDDPSTHAPGTIMPEPRLPDDERDALAGYLATRAMTAARPPAYLSPLDHPTLPAAVSAVSAAGATPTSGATDLPATAQAGEGRNGGERTYQRRCAVCHGVAGGGDGFNARYLDAAPTAHADPEAMAVRPDDTLFDGIAAGGRILGRSARMPAFGSTLEPQEIRALVTYIRRLCDCAPPAWSTDGPR